MAGQPPTPSGHFWWQSGVIYQIYPRSFKDSNGDGIGDLPGIIEKLEYLTGTLGVDGFRVDVAHYIMKDPELRDNPPNPNPADRLHRPLSEYNTQLHLHDRGHPDVHAVYREFRRLLDEYSRDQPRISIGEIHIYDWPLWITYYGEVLDELHMPFNFALLSAGWQAQAVRQVVDGLEAALPPGAWPNYVLGNHDVPRLASRIGSRPARLAAMLLLTLRGTPTLYYGDEVGMTDVPVPPDQQQDTWGIRMPGLGRDPERSPMQWEDRPHAGFSPPGTVRTWLPIAPDYRQVNVTVQLEEPDSILNLYRCLLAYRRSSPALQTGAYKPLDGMPGDCFVYVRHQGDRRVLVALNISALEARLSLPALGRGRLMLSTALDRAGDIDLSDLLLRGYEGVIVEL